MALTASRGGAPPVSAADLYAMGLLDEAMHLAVARFRQDLTRARSSTPYPGSPRAWAPTRSTGTLFQFCEEFPPLVVHRGERSARASGWRARPPGCPIGPSRWKS